MKKRSPANVGRTSKAISLEELYEWSRRLPELNQVLRMQYLKGEAAGITHVEMAVMAQMPQSSFTMWLRGTRDLVKVSQVAAVASGCRELAAELLLQ